MTLTNIPVFVKVVDPARDATASVRSVEARRALQLAGDDLARVGFEPPIPPAGTDAWDELSTWVMAAADSLLSSQTGADIEVRPGLGRPPGALNSYAAHFIPTVRRNPVPYRLSHPGFTMWDMSQVTERDQLLFNIEGRISRYGWSCYYIFGGAGPPWLYTIGLVEGFGHPELIIFGLDQSSAHGLATRVVERLTSEVKVPPGRHAGERLDGLPVAYLEVDRAYWREPSDYFLGWLDYYRALERTLDQRALQLVWSDEQGHLPWDERFSARLRHLQPLLDVPPQ